MDYKKLNTTIDFEFADGDKVKLTLAFYALYQLKSRDKKLYDRYNQVMLAMSKEKYDELDTIVILYVAYICALEKGAVPMSEIDFIMKCGTDRKAVSAAVKELTNPKKK